MTVNSGFSMAADAGSVQGYSYMISSRGQDGQGKQYHWLHLPGQEFLFTDTSGQWEPVHQGNYRDVFSDLKRATRVPIILQYADSAALAAKVDKYWQSGSGSPAREDLHHTINDLLGPDNVVVGELIVNSPMQR